MAGGEVAGAPPNGISERLPQPAPSAGPRPLEALHRRASVRERVPKRWIGPFCFTDI